MPGSRRSLTFRNKSDLVDPKPVELHLDVVAPGCGDLANLVGMPRRHCEFERTGAAAYLGDLVSESSDSGLFTPALTPRAAEFQRRQHDSVAYQSQRPVTVPVGGLESQGRGRGSKGLLGLLRRPYGRSVNHLQRVWNASAAGIPHHSVESRSAGLRSGDHVGIFLDDQIAALLGHLMKVVELSLGVLVEG